MVAQPANVTSRNRLNILCWGRVMRVVVMLVSSAEQNVCGMFSGEC